MINNLLKKFKLEFKKIFKNDWISKLDKFEKRIRKKEKRLVLKPLRVLVGPAFAIYPSSYFMDRALSYAFRLRGAQVIPMYCDGIQHTECNYIGGDWGGKENFKKNCESCQQTSKRLWHLNPIKPLPFSRYVSNVDSARIAEIISPMDYEEAAAYQVDGIEYGRMAKDILVNNYLVATPALIEGYKDLLKIHLKNLLLVNLAYARILDEKKPDRVVSNDSYYGMWAILEKQCQARSIPFYSHWPVTESRVAFAYNEAVMNLDFTKSWGVFSKTPLSNTDEERINKWLAGDRGYVIDATKLAGHESAEPILNLVDLQKPTLLAAANVIWDLAALNKQVVFKDMNDWILQTVEWFRNNENYQLIIRPHPGEVSPMIPRTKETIESIVALSGVHLPKNVFLLKPDAKVTFSELIEQFNIRGVAVHTTTVGFECPAKGVPVITTAKSPYRGFGFTIDPVTPAEYFSAIHELLKGDAKEVSEDKRLLAKKFIKFYHFHYYSNTGLFKGNPFKGRPPEMSNDLMGVLTSNESAFGYVVNSIMDGVPINDSERWIPET